MALQVTAHDLEHELLMVWRREMLTGVYRPRWVDVHTAAGPVAAITFVVNSSHRCHCRLEDDEVVRLLATGRGLLGTSAAYLESTVDRLDAEGIDDKRLRALHDRVVAYKR